jgi:hypothetical protein
MRSLPAAIAVAAVFAAAAPGRAQAPPRPYPPAAAAMPMAGAPGDGIADELNREELRRITGAAGERRRAWRDPSAWRNPPPH